MLCMNIQFFSECQLFLWPCFMISQPQTVAAFQFFKELLMHFVPLPTFKRRRPRTMQTIHSLAFGGRGVFFAGGRRVRNPKLRKSAEHNYYSQDDHDHDVVLKKWQSTSTTFVTTTMTTACNTTAVNTITMTTVQTTTTIDNESLNGSAPSATTTVRAHTQIVVCRDNTPWAIIFYRICWVL